jgi:hypothetical protein
MRSSANVLNPAPLIEIVDLQINRKTYGYQEPKPMAAQERIEPLLLTNVSSRDELSENMGNGCIRG